MSDDQKPRNYTMTEKAIAQRRAASEASKELSTGPKSTEGKASSSRNAWKHGNFSAVHQAQFGLGAASLSKMFGNPCRTTCPFHPDNPDRTDHPCKLVLDGLTRAGGNCLDKTVYLHAFDALIQAMQNGEMEPMHGMLAQELAGNLEIMSAMRKAIAEHGVYTAIYKHDFDGKVITHGLDENGEPKPMIFELKINPAVMALAKFSETLGLNFAELMATPRERAKQHDDENKTDAMHALLGGLIGRMGRRPRTIEHNDD